MCWRADAIRGPEKVRATILLVVSLWATDAAAAGRNVTIHADDGRAITATLFEANRLPAPAVILVPALGHPRNPRVVLQ